MTPTSPGETSPRQPQPLWIGLAIMLVWMALVVPAMARLMAGEPRPTEAIAGPELVAAVESWYAGLPGTDAPTGPALVRTLADPCACDTDEPAWAALSARWQGRAQLLQVPTAPALPPGARVLVFDANRRLVHMGGFGPVVSCLAGRSAADLALVRALGGAEAHLPLVPAAGCRC